MKIYTLFNDDGFTTGQFYDDMSYPPVTEKVSVRPAEGSDDLPESEWPTETHFVRRNDSIPEEAVEISELDRAAIVAAPQFRKWQDGTLVSLPIPQPAASPLPTISDRQFGEGLWRAKLISFDEYLAFVGPGTVPPPLLAIINTLADDDTGNPTPRKVALGLVTGAQSYAFDNPLVDVVRQAQGWTVDYLRERWAEWAAL